MHDLLTSRSPERPLKVAFIVPGLPGGLGMIHAKKLVRAIQGREGVESHVQFVSPGLDPFRFGVEAFRVWRALRRFRPDVVHGHFGGKVGLVTVLAAALVGARSVVHFRGSDLNPAPVDGWLRSGALNLASQVACALADFRIFVSRQLAERAWFQGRMRGAYQVEPSGHDESVFHPADRAASRATLGLEEGVPVLAFIAGTNPAVKGEPLVLQAVERLKGQVPFVLVRVGGDWPPERVATLMNAADCLVFASPYEGSPCVVQEALACGLPIVSVDVGDVADISRGTGAVDIVARNPDVLAGALAGRLRHPSRVPPPEAVLASGFAASAARYVDLYRRIAVPADHLSGRLLRGVSWTAAGNLVSAASTLLATMGVARMLGPGRFGEFGLVQNTLGFFVLLIGPSLGLTATKYVAELRSGDLKRLARVLRLANRATYAITLVVAVGLFLSAPTLSREVLKAPELVPHLRLASLALVLMTVNGVQLGVLSGFEAFRAVAIVNAVRGLAILPSFWLGARWYGSLGAVWGLVIAWGLACLASALLVRSTLLRAGVPRNVGGAWSERRLLIGFSLPGWVGGILVGAANWTGSVILARQPDGLAQTGILNAANQLFLLLMFLPQVLGQAGLPLLMEREGANDTEGARRVLRRLVLLNLAVTLPGALVLGGLAPFIMERLGIGFAPHWPVLVASVATVPLYALGQTGINRIMAQARMWTAASAHLVYLLAFVGLAFTWRGGGAMGFAMARLATYALFAAVIFGITHGPPGRAAPGVPDRP